jgi:hypothetical protein
MARQSTVLSRGRRNFAAGVAAIGLLVGTLAAAGPALAVTTIAPAVPANVSVGLPSWWAGSPCDATRWNKLALAADWPIRTTNIATMGSHPLGASYLGVPVCGPRPGIDGSPDILWARPGWGEAEWECVELAQRFMAQFYGVSAYGANGGYVVDNYRTAYGGDLVRYYNTGAAGIAPTPGDVISMLTPLNPWGHTVVVAASTVDGNGNGELTLLSQNDTSDGWRTINVVNWKVQGFNTFTVKDWLHDPAGRANPLADGTFVRVTGQTQVYRLAGGAPIPVTDWTQFGGLQQITTIAAAQFNGFNAYPTNGTYIKDAMSGQIYRMAGGAPEGVGTADAAKLPGWGNAPVIAIDHNALLANAHLRAYPADRTFVCNVSGLNCYEIAGGAPMLVPLSDQPKIAGWSSKTVTILSDYEFNTYTHLRPTPADGTYICDLTTTGCYRTAGGAPMQISPIDAAKLPGWSPTAAIKTSHWEFVNFQHLRAYPNGGTYICNVTDASCYVTAGGAPLYVRSGAAASVVPGQTPVTLSGAEFANFTHLRQRPANGTLLTSAQTGLVFATSGGAAYNMTKTTTLALAPSVKVDQGAIDNAGLLGPWNHLASAAASVTMLSPSTRLMAGKAALVSWVRPVASSAVTGYDIRYRTGTPTTRLGAWNYPATWQGFTGNHVWAAMKPGMTLCVQVRAHNRAGQTGAWSPARCVGNVVDMRSPGITSRGWHITNVTNTYTGVLFSTNTKGSWWQLQNVGLDRIGLVATVCLQCGAVRVLVNNVQVGVINLSAPTARVGMLVSLPPFAYRTGTLKLVVISPNNHPVQFSGVAISSA